MNKRSPVDSQFNFIVDNAALMAGPPIYKTEAQMVFEGAVRHFTEKCAAQREAACKEMLEAGMHPPEWTLCEKVYFDEKTYTMKYKVWPDRVWKLPKNLP